MYVTRTLPLSLIVLSSFLERPVRVSLHKNTKPGLQISLPFYNENKFISYPQISGGGDRKDLLPFLRPEIAEEGSSMLYAFFWVIPRRLNFICRRFGTLCLFHLHRQVPTCFLLGNSPAAEYYMPTFRNTLSFPSS